MVGKCFQHPQNEKVLQKKGVLPVASHFDSGVDFGIFIQVFKQCVILTPNKNESDSGTCQGFKKNLILAMEKKGVPPIEPLFDSG